MADAGIFEVEPAQPPVVPERRVARPAVPLDELRLRHVQRIQHRIGVETVGDAASVGFQSLHRADEILVPFGIVAQVRQHLGQVGLARGTLETEDRRHRRVGHLVLLDPLDLGDGDVEPAAADVFLKQDFLDHAKRAGHVVAMLRQLAQHVSFEMGAAEVRTQGGDHRAIGKMQTEARPAFAARGRNVVQLLTEKVFGGPGDVVDPGFGGVSGHGGLRQSWLLPA